MDQQDLEGAEGFLSAALAGPSSVQLMAHYQLGRLYLDWNKLSSAIAHLEQAVDLAQSEKENLFLIQIMSELERAKKIQRSQCP